MRILLYLVLLAGCAGVAVAEDAPPPGAPPPSAALLAKADGVFRSRAYDAARGLYEQAVTAAEVEGASETLVEALSQVARMYLIRDRRKEGEPWLARAARLATPKAPKGWSRYVGVRGRFEWKADDKPAAARTFEALYTYCVEHELWSRAVDAAHMVAIVGSLEQQLAWGLKGIAAAERGGMDGWLGPLWNNLGNTYLELARPEDALAAFLRARHYHWQGTSEHRKLVADWAVGMAARKAGKLAQAKQWLRPVLAWAERRKAEAPDDPERGEWIGLAAMQLGLIALAEKRMEDARRDLARALPLLQAADMASWDPGAWKELLDGIAGAKGGTK